MEGKRKKNKNGQGGVYLKGNKYYGRCTNTETGDLHYTKYYDTKKEAEMALEKLKAELYTHTYIAPNKITLLDLIQEYVDDQYKNNEIIANTYRTKLDTIKRIERMSIAKIPIQKITIRQIKDCLHSTINQSQTIIDKDYQLINVGFKCAVTRGILLRNPFDSNLELKKPRSKKIKEKVEAFSVADQQLLLKSIQDCNIRNVHKNMILLSLLTGMRSGEIRALKTSDIDFKNNVITIKRTASRDEKGHTIIGETTKTKKGTRIIPIADVRLREVLKTCFREYKFNSNNYLFCNENLNIFSANTLNDKIKKVCKLASIRTGKKVTFHMLRHTFATRCVESGIGFEVLKEILGHENISTTIDTYTDVSTEYKKESMEKCFEYMERKKVL